MAQPALAVSKLDMSAIANCIRSKLDNLAASFRKQDCEGVAFIDSGGDSAYLRVAAIHTDEMGLSVLADVTIESERELCIHLCGAAMIFKPPEPEVCVFHQSPLSLPSSCLRGQGCAHLHTPEPLRW